MLTKDQMLNAKFARTVQEDPNFDPHNKSRAVYDYAYANCAGSGKERQSYANKERKNYLQGSRVLNGHAMRQTNIRPIGTDPLLSEIKGSDQTLTMDYHDGSYTLCFTKTHK